MNRFQSLMILFVITVSSLNSQAVNGEIEYERKVFWINIMSKLPYITQEDIDRDMLTWGKNQGKYAQPHMLYFDGAKTLYKEKESDENYGYSWVKENYTVIHDHKKREIKQHITLLNKDYVVEGEMPKMKWKILNEIREIAGYLCMKAETVDPVKGNPVYAWFTDRIPVSGGPEGYYGLPGMILALEMNGDDVLVTATKVTIKEELDLPIPKKMKGKKIDLEEFATKQKEHIEKSVEGRKNPYWQMRY